MRFRMLPLLLVASLLWLAPGSSAHATDADVPQKHFLWKVTGPKGVVYLLGTVHVAKPELYPLPAVIEERFKQADTLVEEVDLGEATNTAQHFILEEGTYPLTDTVANHLTEITSARLATYFENSGKEAAIARMKPWLISLMILRLDTKRQGYDPALGLDKHFTDEARQAHKPVEGLETVESQLRLFSSLSDEFQDRLLLSSLLESEEGGERIDQMLHAWQTGDADAMREILYRDARDYPQLKPLMKTMLDDRNDAMTKQIEGFLRTPRTFFVAVGAGHLVGDRGILDQLRQEHFQVEQL
jgi:uncharacterized protein YbaP (TraB family)